MAAIDSPHLGALAHIPGNCDRYLEIPSYELDPTITVRAAAAGSMTAADAALVAALPGKIVIKTKNADGTYTTGYMIYFV